MPKSLVVLIALLTASAASAIPAIIPSAPQISASGYILIDANSGKVIAESNADEQLPPASLTKLMTSYVLSYDLKNNTDVSNDDKVLVSKRAWAQNPVFAGSSLMWIEVGKRVSLGELHKGIIISSGNDASVAVAEHLAGSELAFADVMNQHAQILGMDNTNFVNAHGLPDPEHYTTARDLATLSQAILRFPKSYALYSQHDYTFNNIRTTNRNRLLFKDPSVDGLKTGHTQEAGYCLVTSAKRNDMRLISVVMGATSESARERETQKLLSYGFRYFETHALYNEGAQLAESQVWSGVSDKLSLGVNRDIHLTIPRGKHKAIKAVLNIDEIIQAPVVMGKVYGELRVTLDGETLLAEPLVALNSIDEGAFLKRLFDGIALFFKQLVPF